MRGRGSNEYKEEKNMVRGDEVKGREILNKRQGNKEVAGESSQSVIVIKLEVEIEVAKNEIRVTCNTQGQNRKERIIGSFSV